MAALCSAPGGDINGFLGLGVKLSDQVANSAAIAVESFSDVVDADLYSNQTTRA